MANDQAPPRIQKRTLVLVAFVLVSFGTLVQQQRRISGLESTISDLIRHQSTINALARQHHQIPGGTGLTVDVEDNDEGFWPKPTRVWGPHIIDPNDEFYNVREPTKAVYIDGKRKKFKKLDLEERLRYLEMKTNAYMNWGNWYDLDSQVDENICKHTTNLVEFDPACDADGKDGVIGDREATPSERSARDEKCPGLFDHWVCLDYFPPKLDTLPPKPNAAPCLVYDFGIREQPQFGMVMAKHFKCEVHAFDPSPVSTAWAKDNLKDIPNYNFHGYGAGGRDGSTKLFKYNWEQVSSVRFPMYNDRWKCLIAVIVHEKVIVKHIILQDMLNVFIRRHVG